MRLRLGVIATLLVCAAPACGGAAQRPPTGLTAYGRVVWNLDALLHDRKAIWQCASTRRPIRTRPTLWKNSPLVR